MNTHNTVVTFLLNQMANDSVADGLRIEAAKTLISLGMPDTTPDDSRNIDPAHCDEILSLVIPNWDASLHQLLVNYGYEKGIDVSESSNPTQFIQIYMDWMSEE